MKQTSAAPARRLTLFALVGAMYFIVSGGPYGLEELVQKVGFGPAIGVLLATPFAWCVPTAMMVGELASAYPEEGGYYAWVRRALGPFWGFQEAWLSLASSVFDMAIYPTLFVLYLGKLAPSLGAHPIAVSVVVIAVGVAWNLRGAFAVGEGSALMTIALLAPFVILTVLAIAHPGAARVAASHASDAAAGEPVDLAGAVLITMWNYMGWDNSSTVAGEVERPQSTYPLAVLIAVSLVAITYVVPVGAMWIGGVDPSEWTTGSWVDGARIFGGAPLAAAVVVGGMVSAFGMFNALTMSFSRVPMVLADDGLFPAVFARRAKNGAPWVSIVACALAWTLSLGLPFERLVSLDILLYGTSLVLEFVALVVLRRRDPDRPRPFRVPGGTVGAALLGVPPTAILGFALIKNADEQVGGMNALVFGAIVIVAGALAYVVLARRAAAPRVA